MFLFFHLFIPQILVEYLGWAKYCAKSSVRDECELFFPGGKCAIASQVSSEIEQIRVGRKERQKGRGNEESTPKRNASKTANY